MWYLHSWPAGLDAPPNPGRACASCLLWYLLISFLALLALLVVYCLEIRKVYCLSHSRCFARLRRWRELFRGLTTGGTTPCGPFVTPPETYGELHISIRSPSQHFLGCTDAPPPFIVVAACLWWLCVDAFQGAVGLWSWMIGTAHETVVVRHLLSMSV